MAGKARKKRIRKLDRWEVLEGDCRKVLRRFEPNTFDSVNPDPPYGIEFMLRGWDHEVPDASYWKEILRVAKPGAHMPVFGGTRTWHRLACAVEDAGWQIRDTIMWVYGVGFPHNANTALAFDKANGKVKNRGKRLSTVGNDGAAPTPHAFSEYIPISDEAKHWDGYGTALRPSWEPILLCQKPFKGNIVTNLRKWGTGVLNIDAGRISTDWDERPESWKRSGHTKKPGADKIAAPDGNGILCHALGRWPANLVASGAPVEQLFKAGGVLFFYTAKASRTEREAGLGHLPKKRVSDGRRKANDTAYQRGKTERRNTHPTVKPWELIRWLVKLSTPAGGHVLDPFCGSGTTGLSVADGFRFTGIDLSGESCIIARARIVEALERAGKATREDLSSVPGRKLIQLGMNV